MAAAWEARARDIAEHPMPGDLQRIVDIMCNDCETKSHNRNWHFLGIQCPNCRPSVSSGCYWPGNHRLDDQQVVAVAGRLLDHFVVVAVLRAVAFGRWQEQYYY